MGTFSLGLAIEASGQAKNKRRTRQVIVIMKNGEIASLESCPDGNSYTCSCVSPNQMCVELRQMGLCGNQLICLSST